MKNKKNILVTSALPYANGSLHLGHILEFIQTDIWVRFNKMLGHKCIYIGADDAHGTAIMIKAQKLGITPEQLIDAVNQEHQHDLKNFLIDFDYYGSTHCEENRILSYKIFNKLLSANYITTRQITQLFDTEKSMFLSDRFVKGTCPTCHAVDQYGDNCEECGSTYNAIDLIEPYSTLSNTPPIKKQSKHYFLQLNKFNDLLERWLNSGSLQPEVKNKLQEWMNAGLQDWDISRDSPYFGFTIPGEIAKYFYVWLDAPVGYMSAFAKYAEKNNLDFNNYWQDDKAENTELHHFIGKDILYFHGLFWPAMLQGSGHRLPTGIYAHGFVTVDGKKMSKSRGTFINASSYLQQLNPEYLRYYFASKLTSKVQDIDINLADFITKTNANLIGKIINIASRSCKFINNYFENQLGEIEHSDILDHIISTASTIADNYHHREYSKAIKEIMNLADKTNQYIDNHKPWILVKNPSQLALAHRVSTTAINAFKILVTYLQPVLPELNKKVATLLNSDLKLWSSHTELLTNHTINKFEPLMSRVTQEQIDSMLSSIVN